MCFFMSLISPNSHILLAVVWVHLNVSHCSFSYFFSHHDPFILCSPNSCFYILYLKQHTVPPYHVLPLTSHLSICFFFFFVISLSFKYQSFTPRHWIEYITKVFPDVFCSNDKVFSFLSFCLYFFPHLAELRALCCSASWSVTCRKTT